MTSGFDDGKTCEDVNRYAIEVAENLLYQTPNGEMVMARHKFKGRPICLKKDFTPFGNIGPLFIKESISIKDNGDCLEVASLADGPTKLTSHIFPGIHYCKLLSPARVIDYYMTDSLKAISGCLNKEPKKAAAAVYLQ